MEWSLEDVIRDKSQQLTEADVKSYMQMVLQALAHVHEQQAIHRCGRRCHIVPHSCCVPYHASSSAPASGLAPTTRPSTDN
jgi:hypothetical protein